MATISFKEELVIADKKKTLEIALALKQPKDKTIRPAEPQKLPEKAKTLWFKR